MKKGQMEILGLVVVMLLVSFGLVFYLVNVLTEEPSDLKWKYDRAEMANNMLGATMSTTLSECNEATVRELLQDCAESQAIICSQGGTHVDSCGYAQLVVSDIFQQTFVQWNVPFRFSVYVNELAEQSDEPFPFLLQHECEDLRAVKNVRSALRQYAIRQGLLYVKVDLC